MPPLTEEQHRIRATGIGSSDIGAIAGESPWATPHSVWMDKVGLSERSEDTGATWLGNQLEPILAARYAEEVGVDIAPGPGTVRHPDYPWALCSTDFEHADGSSVVECKVVGWRVEHHWDDSVEDGIPAYVAAQQTWQMGIRGIKAAAVPVLFTSDARFRIFRAKFDPRVFDALLKIGERFWHDRVLAHRPPDADGSEDARAMLARLYPRNTRNLVEAPEGAVRLATDYTLAREAEKAAKARAQLAGNKLREMIGDARGVHGPWGRVTWTVDKTGKRTLRVNVKEAA